MVEAMKAFVIFDDEIFGNMICKMLSKLNVDAKLYSEPSDALSDVERFDPELVFLDFKLPEVSNDNLMIKYEERALFLKRRVVLVTSLCDIDENQAVCQSLGVENILKKPISFDDVEKIISHQKKEKELKQLSSKHIAVVDDDEISAKILIKNLERNNLSCSYFASGEQFLEGLREGNIPDLVLLDILMPGVSGIGVLKKVREKHKSVELPIIMLTAKTEALDIIEALNLGANDYITKPANPDVALARIRTQIEMNSYYEDSLKKMELETLAAMIITYNHEINTPLGVALLNMKEDLSQMTDKNYEDAMEAIERIVSIVKSIRTIVSDGPEYSEYAGGQKMIKIKGGTG